MKLSFTVTKLAATMVGDTAEELRRTQILFLSYGNGRPDVFNIAVLKNLKLDFEEPKNKRGLMEDYFNLDHS